MNLIIAIGKEGEIAFNNRRVSRDEHLLRDVFESVDGDVYIKPRSAKMFASFKNVKIVENANECPSDAWLFIEDEDALTLTEKAEKIIIYNFNRIYPYDVRLNTDSLSGKFRVVSSMSFLGHSHEKITKTIYEKE